MATATGHGAHLSGDLALTAAGSSSEQEAFEHFPYGLLVLDRTGRVVCRNRAAERLIGAAELARDELTCCALLGCGLPDTVLEAGCLTDLALGREHVLPEIRVELRSLGGGASAMWVTAAAIDGARARVVLQLRPGDARDRRRRTSPHWMGAPRLRIYSLGATRVESAEGPIDGAWLDQRTGQLLKYLVAERRRALTVDEIGESIWPGADYAVGASVRYYVHALRRRLEPERGSREPSMFIASRCGTYRLQLEHVAIDADEFELRLSAGMAAAKLDQRAGVGEIEQALALYRGDFLADLPYAEWAMAERHRLHELACIGLRRLSEIHLQRRGLVGAAGALERLAALQPFDEDVHRRLMEVDIMRGRRSDAVRRYATLRCRLRRTFGHDPDFTPADLARPRL